MSDDRLTRQISFLLEVDRLKGVLRRSYVLGGERRENSAEHSWHVAIAALLLAEHANTEVDLARVVTMLLVHDLVEVEAGDTFIYDQAAMTDRSERERRAADRLFALLPGDQGAAWRLAWEEYEARETEEACFAAALDRLLPVLLNFASRGKAWQEHGVRADQVAAVNRGTADGSRRLWEHICSVIEEAVSRGYLARGDANGVRPPSGSPGS